MAWYNVRVARGAVFDTVRQTDSGQTTIRTTSFNTPIPNTRYFNVASSFGPRATCAVIRNPAVRPRVGYTVHYVSGQAAEPKS
jgi:hypothetical protein